MALSADRALDLCAADKVTMDRVMPEFKENACLRIAPFASVEQGDFGITQFTVQLIQAFSVPFVSVFGGGYVFDDLHPPVSGFDDGLYGGNHGSRPSK